MSCKIVRRELEIFLLGPHTFISRSVNSKHDRWNRIAFLGGVKCSCDFYAICTILKDAFLLLVGIGFFCFSSRRRHTRYIGDWSSDLCSSDLSPNSSSAMILLPFMYGNSSSILFNVKPSKSMMICSLVRPGNISANARILAIISKGSFIQMSDRSEERRVGKECRFRWSHEHYQKIFQKHEQVIDYIQAK